jgi:hypothetical protein
VQNEAAFGIFLSLFAIGELTAGWLANYLKQRYTLSSRSLFCIMLLVRLSGDIMYAFVPCTFGGTVFVSAFVSGSGTCVHLLAEGYVKVMHIRRSLAPGRTRASQSFFLNPSVVSFLVVLGFLAGRCVCGCV